MRSHELGFVSSWKMLTRDKGWIKPLLVLTLVSWIPILGQIAVLGYGLEWARLTAWGVDSAPKQRGVQYGKVLTTGGIGFLVALTMSIVLGLANIILFGGAYVGAAFPLLSGMTISGLAAGTGGGLLFGGVSFAAVLLMMIVNVFFGTFISAAMMRSTVYDSFSAGWRIDRLFQMVIRDLGGFFHTYAVSLIGSIVSGLASMLITVAGVLVVGVSAFALAYGMPVDGIHYDPGALLMHIGAFPILVFVILAIVAFFAVQVVGVAMQLVSINAMGQWFCRYDVNRWGVSSAPLPVGTPRDFSGVSVGFGSAPCPPVEPTMPDEEVTQPAESVPAESAPAEQGHAEPEAAAPVPAESATMKETPEAEQQAPSADSPLSREPEAEKRAIPLGPITTDDEDKKDGDGPIQA